ncbi:DUF4822 domain-containing protein [Rummeliibacillus sp. NPDC094406]|uniref:DUF4822 domain-containing protein n=1 Tax=Rummeliibacillus sp. NPDC094406 TaxID=3364511 RepID=UPI0038304479
MKKVLMVLVLVNMLILSACQWQGFGKQDITTGSKNGTKIPVNSEVKGIEESTLNTGVKIAKILGSTTWQGTKVYDKNNNDLTQQNTNFIALAKYDDKTSRYEFYDKTSKDSRDNGTFFITNSGKFRILKSKSKGTQSVVELTEVTEEKYTYKRMGKDANGNDVEVFVEHIPYTEGKLAFSESE